ncbi:MAG: type I methionyl aminopeptidase [Candidatus Uhrbacteria bacterium]|nr:type I methionyl aminopeptidase [Candidatus Uhrbacteria bacterium]
MSMIKTAEEIQAMREGGALLSRALQKAVDAVRPGITMRELDDIARTAIEKGGGKPSFLGYKSGGGSPFPSTMCISRNEEVVHGLGNRDLVLEEGDIVGLDIGCWYKGLCTDMAASVPVGSISDERKALLRVTRDSMRAGVLAARVGGVVLDIGGAVEDVIDQKKYGIVKSLVGHGVGHAVHESPHVPNYRGKGFPKTKLEAGMCLAIEPMVTLGTDEVEVSDDDWTIVTKDGTDAAHFEVTIAVLPEGPELLTPEPKIDL